MPLRGHGRRREYQPTLPPPWQKCHVQRPSANDGGEWPYLAAVEPKFAPGLVAGFSGATMIPFTGNRRRALSLSAVAADGGDAVSLRADGRWCPTGRHHAASPHAARAERSRHRHAQAEDPHRVFGRLARRFQWPGELLQARTENRERRTFNPNELTAAHRTLPFGTRVRVTNVATGKTVTVRVNDRGPFIDGRVIDVSHSAAESLGMVGQGVAKVKLDVVQ